VTPARRLEAEEGVARQGRGRRDADACGGALTAGLRSRLSDGEARREALAEVEDAIAAWIHCAKGGASEWAADRPVTAE
jgi:hypothetical protein